MEPLKTEDVKMVWYQDLNRYIEACLGRPWCVQQNGEVGQDSLLCYNIEPVESDALRAWLASPPAQHPGRHLYSDMGGGETVDIWTDDILNHMCREGHLPAGTLYVHVWW